MRKIILACLIMMPTLALADDVIVEEPVDTGEYTTIDDGSTGAVDYVLIDDDGSDDNGIIDDNHIIDDTGAKVVIKIDPRESNGFWGEPRCSCIGIDHIAAELPEEPLGTVALAKTANKNLQLASAGSKDKSHKDHTGNKKK